MRTQLKPYKHELYSPHKFPPKLGEVVILLDEPRGYVGILVGVDDTIGIVRLLDSQAGDFKTPLTSLLPTGKTPTDLTSQYSSTPEEFSQNLSVEREFPDFSRIKKKKGGGKKKEPKKMTQEQKVFLAKLIKQKLEELKK